MSDTIKVFFRMNSDGEAEWYIELAETDERRYRDIMTLTSDEALFLARQLWAVLVPRYHGMRIGMTLPYSKEDTVGQDPEAR